MIKSGRMNEAVESINESAKVRDMNKNDGQAFSGCYTLPSGRPGLTTSNDDIEIVVIADGDNAGIELLMLDEDDNNYVRRFKANEESKAISTIKQMAKDLTDLTSSEKLAKKYGLKKFA